MVHNRRQLLRAAAATAVFRATANSQTSAKMRLGIILGLSADPEADIKRVHDLGFPTCQLGIRAIDDALNELRTAHVVESTRIKAQNA